MLLIFLNRASIHDLNLLHCPDAIVKLIHQYIKFLIYWEPQESVDNKYIWFVSRFTYVPLLREPVHDIIHLSATNQTYEVSVFFFGTKLSCQTILLIDEKGASVHLSNFAQYGMSLHSESVVKHNCKGELQIVFEKSLRIAMRVEANWTSVNEIICQINTNDSINFLYE